MFTFKRWGVRLLFEEVRLLFQQLIHHKPAVSVAVETSGESESLVMFPSELRMRLCGRGLCDFTLDVWVGGSTVFDLLISTYLRAVNCTMWHSVSVYLCSVKFLSVYWEKQNPANMTTTACLCVFLLAHLHVTVVLRASCNLCVCVRVCVLMLVCARLSASWQLWDVSGFGPVAQQGVDRADYLNPTKCQSVLPHSFLHLYILYSLTFLRESDGKCVWSSGNL